MKCLLHREALAEYKQAAFFYAERAPGLGDAFATQVEKAIIAIKVAPRAHAANEGGVRGYLLRRFPALIALRYRAAR